MYKSGSKISGLNCIAAVMTLAAMILFLVNTGDYRFPVSVIICSAVAMLANIVMLFYKDSFGFLPILASALNLACLVIVIASQLNNIAMLATGVGLGNSSVPVTFFLSAILYLIAVVFNAVNVFKKVN